MTKMMTMASPAAISSTTPSFNSYSAGNRFEQIAARVITELAAADPETDDLFDEGDAGAASDSEEFEFSVVCRDPDSAPITADELFANGQIRPLFPIFNSDLVFHGGGGGGSPSPAAATVRLPLRKLMAAGGVGEEKPPAPEEDYCVWTPGSAPASAPASPERCKKSKSTGSTRRWRLRDLLHRSGSDGKDTLVFLSPAATGRSSGRPEIPKTVARPAAAKVVRGRPANSPARSPAKPMEYYIRDRAMREGDRRRSYLPYRQDIVGFFASVNGLSRPHH